MNWSDKTDYLWLKDGQLALNIVNEHVLQPGARITTFEFWNVGPHLANSVQPQIENQMK